MGKLNIAHHKSYHPYRLDNIERVRRDEEEARLKEEGIEGRIKMADSEARLALLRGRSGGAKKAKRKDDEDPQTQPVAALTTITTSSGHINLFADFEQQAMSTAMVRAREVTKKGAKSEDEKGVRLAPSDKDLNPWYADKQVQEEEPSDDKRMKELSAKMSVDPLTSIKSELSRSYPSSSQVPPPPRARRPAPSSNATDARIQRESAERARAMELIRRKKREREREALGMGNMTPSSVGGEDLDRSGGYGDVYNREETEEAHRRRERGWARERGSRYQERRRDRDATDSYPSNRGYRHHRW